MFPVKLFLWVMVCFIMLVSLSPCFNTSFVALLSLLLLWLSVQQLQKQWRLPIIIWIYSIIYKSYSFEISIRNMEISGRNNFNLSALQKLFKVFSEKKLMNKIIVYIFCYWNILKWKAWENKILQNNKSA